MVQNDPNIKIFGFTYHPLWLEHEENLACKLLNNFYRHFDKDKSGKLNHQEFKSCLRALGYDLPMVEEGQRDPEFETILDMVDPNRYRSLEDIHCS